MFERSSASTQSEDSVQFLELIDEFITVGIDSRSTKLSSANVLKWVTSIQLLNDESRRDKEVNTLVGSSSLEQFKFIELSPGLTLAIGFCQPDLEPITRIRVFQHPSEDWQKIEHPNQRVCDEWICYQTIQHEQSKRIIEDVVVLTLGEEESEQLNELPNEPYEAVRVPQSLLKEGQLQFHYLLLRTIDVYDLQAGFHAYEAKMTKSYRLERAKAAIDYRSVSMFCFPKGIQLYPNYVGCGYEVFNYILTQQNSQRLYVNCLKFKQALNSTLKEGLSINSFEKTMSNLKYQFYDRALCIVSRRCCTDLFRKVLEEIYRQYLSKRYGETETTIVKSFNSCSLPIVDEAELFDQIVCDFVTEYEKQVHRLMKPVRRQAHWAEKAVEQGADAEQQVKMNWGNILLRFPIRDTIHTSPKAIYCLFKMLSIETIMQIFEAVLLEKNVIFVCDSQVVLGYVIEAVLSFLFPLKWEHVILPMLPNSLVEYLQSPFPIIAGLSSNMIDVDMMNNKGIFVFLNYNKVVPTDSCYSRYNIAQLKQTYKKLACYQVYEPSHVSEFLRLQDQYYTFNLTFMEERMFSPKHIRNIFFETILHLLCDYEVYCQLETGQCFSFRKHYMTEQFISSHPRSAREFMTKFCQTSIFGNFIQRKYLQPDNPEIVLFDNAILQKKALYFRDHLLDNFCNRLSEKQVIKNETILRKNMSLPETLSTMIQRQESDNQNNTSSTQSLTGSQFGQSRGKSKTADLCNTISKIFRRISVTRTDLSGWESEQVNRLTEVQRTNKNVAKEPQKSEEEGKKEELIKEV